MKIQSFQSYLLNLRGRGGMQAHTEIAQDKRKKIDGKRHGFHGHRIPCSRFLFDFSGIRNKGDDTDLRSVDEYLGDLYSAFEQAEQPEPQGQPVQMEQSSVLYVLCFRESEGDTAHIKPAERIDPYSIELEWPSRSPRDLIHEDMLQGLLRHDLPDRDQHENHEQNQGYQKPQNPLQQFSGNAPPSGFFQSFCLHLVLKYLCGETVITRSSLPSCKSGRWDKRDP